jgi:hypothetical protein
LLALQQLLLFHSTVALSLLTWTNPGNSDPPTLLSSLELRQRIIMTNLLPQQIKKTLKMETHHHPHHHPLTHPFLQQQEMPLPLLPIAEDEIPIIITITKTQHHPSGNGFHPN